MAKSVVLDLDDFADSCTCVREVTKLFSSFPNFKINMFAVTEQTSLSTMEVFAGYGCVFYPHGFSHDYLEMSTMGYEEVMKKLTIADRYRQLGLFGGVFKAPYWRYSSESYQALEDKGYIVAISREQFNPPPPHITTYSYDFELDEAWDKSELEVLRLHGHCTPYRNSIDLWCDKLILNFYH
jgi:peptidoglycan/xylan/chitin deacetylase (PgdA/CDA1 family)